MFCLLLNQPVTSISILHSSYCTRLFRRCSTAHNIRRSDFDGACKEVITLCNRGQLDAAFAAFKKNPDRGGAAVLISNVAWKQGDHLERAFDIYSLLCAKTSPNIAVLGSLLMACRRCKQPHKALSLWQDIERHNLELNDPTFGTLVAACLEVGDITVARLLVDKWEAGLRLERPFGYCIQLIQLFTRKSDFDYGLRSYYVLCKQSIPTTGVVGALVSSFEQHNKEHMLESLTVDIQRYSVLLDAHLFGALARLSTTTKDAKLASFLFDNLPKWGLKLNVLDCNQLMQTFAVCNLLGEAQRVLHYMDVNHIKPDLYTYSAILKSCAAIAAVTVGKEIHLRITKEGLSRSLILNTSLLMMYGKAGHITEMEQILAELKDTRQALDIVVWNAILKAYGQNGKGKTVLKLFEELQMTGLSPNKLTLVSVLHSCSHSGLIEEATQLLNNMEELYHIAPDVQHYNCVIDALGRYGKLDEAESLANRVKDPTLITWTTLLSACRLWNDIQRAERIAKHLISLYPSHAPAYVLLSNMYAAARDWSSLHAVRSLMHTNSAKKEPGTSWITTKEGTHKFLVNDTSHPQYKEIQQESLRLHQEMKCMGYIPDLRWNLHDVSDEEKAEALCQHSERSAVVFGLLNTAAPDPIVIAKNLRVLKFDLQC